MSLGLVIVSGDDCGRQYPLNGGRIVIGRDKECAIRLESGRVSRQHAAIEKAPEGFCIRDLGSSNGITINGEKATVHLLNQGDRLKIGGIQLCVDEMENGEDEDFVDAPPPVGEMQTLAGGDGILRTICVSKEDMMTQWAPAQSLARPSRAVHDLEAIYQSGRVMNSVLNADEIVECLLDIVFNALPHADGCSVHMLNEKTDALECQAARNLRVSSLPADQMFSQTIMRQAVRGQEAVLVQDVANDIRIGEEHSLAKMAILSALCVPVQTHDQVFGVIHVHVAHNEKTLNEEDLKLLAAIGLQAGAACSNAQLFQKLDAEKRALEQAHADLKKAQEQLVQSSTLAAVGQLAEGIFHDIKTPLQVIRGFSEMAAIEAGDVLGEKFGGSPLDDCMQKIQQGVDDSTNIITSLMEFARPEEPQPFRFKLHVLLEDTLTFMKAKLYKGQVRVQKNIPPDLPRVFCDPNQLKRVFVNLIMNAVQSMEKGGTIEFTCEIVEHHGWSFVVTHLRDEGHGMDAKQAQHAFDPFYSSRRERDTPNGGLGLGLSVCYGIVKSHGGDIKIKSALGEGCTISVWLPLAEESQPVEPVDAGAAAL